MGKEEFERAKAIYMRNFEKWCAEREKQGDYEKATATLCEHMIRGGLMREELKDMVPRLKVEDIENVIYLKSDEHDYRWKRTYDISEKAVAEWELKAGRWHSCFVTLMDDNYIMITGGDGWSMTAYTLETLETAIEYWNEFDCK
ncbi:MAG: hypothetical protein IKO30_08455 [Lachnospiraceae bacterium]|nr:hypothetical protein [Lachnospiraceae bacterium]